MVAMRKIADEPTAEAELAPEPVVRQFSEIRRVCRADLDMLRPWLWSRISKRYAGATEAQVFAMLLNASTDNNYWFVRNHVAIGLAVLSQEPLRRAKVTEQFVLAINYAGRPAEEDQEIEDLDADDAALSLYHHLLTWAKSYGAAGVGLLFCSDATAKGLRKEVGAVTMETYAAVRF